MPLPAPQPNAVAPPAPGPVFHDVTIVTTRKLAQAKVLGVPCEEFGIERGARDIKTCNYCFHEVVTKTEAQLIAEGYDEEQVKSLTEYTGNTEIETLARDSVGEHFNVGDGGINSAARLVRIVEHYVRMDYDGKGRPCLYQVITGGDQGDILKKDGKECITPFDTMPFAATTPVPITHRFFGRSIADLVMPVQREKTAMKRGALDNMYLANNPRVVVNETLVSTNTLDDLLTSRPGGIVRVKGDAIEWQVVPNITAGIFPMMQYLDAELASRTGMDKQSQGIDANALQNQSATAVAQVFSASQMRMKLIARIMAEGVRDIFALLHGTIRKHGQQSQTVRLRNTWVDVDPRGWKTRDDMTINVGLGTGGKAQQFAQTMAIGNVQKELLAGGMSNIVDPAKLYNTAAELTRIMGHKNPDQFFNDPDAKDPQTGQPLHPPAPTPPDPKTQAIQAQSAANTQATQEKAKLAQFEAQLEAMTKKAEAEMQAKLKLLDAHIRLAGAAQQMSHDHQRHRMDMASGALDMVSTAHKHDAGMAQSQAAHERSMMQPDKTDV